MSVFDLRHALCLGVLAGCAHDADVPQPPDVSQLLSTYAEPAGSVEPSQPAPLLADAELQLNRLGGGQANVVFTRIVAAVTARVDEASLPTSHDGLVPTRVDGVVSLDLRCGAGPEEIANVAAEIVDGTLSRVLWGSSHACALWQAGGLLAPYDGAFVIYRYPGTGFLVRLEGTMAADKSPIRLDFRLLGDRLETRVPTPRGDVIAARVGADLMVRGRNGTFRCSSVERSCSLTDASRGP
jgi:hypothetical protein